jgi:hypothetical protein
MFIPKPYFFAIIHTILNNLCFRKLIQAAVLLREIDLFMARSVAIKFTFYTFKKSLYMGGRGLRPALTASVQVGDP